VEINTHAAWLSGVSAAKGGYCPSGTVGPERVVIVAGLLGPQAWRMYKFVQGEDQETRDHTSKEGWRARQANCQGALGYRIAYGQPRRKDG